MRLRSPTVPPWGLPRYEPPSHCARGGPTSRIELLQPGGDRSRAACHFKMLTARAITRPSTERQAVAWTAIASFAQRASGMTSVGLNAVALVKARYR